MQWSIMQLHCNSNALQFNVNGEYNIEQSKSEEKISDELTYLRYIEQGKRMQVSKWVF